MKARKNSGTTSTAARGAKRKRDAVIRRVEARRAHRIANDEPAVQTRSMEKIEADARTLLAKHKLKVTPATERLAKLHEQMTDAVDQLFDICVTKGKEPRLVSAMVSAGKLAVSTLEKLGLPGDELEDEEAAAREAAAERERKRREKEAAEKRGVPAPKDEAARDHLSALED